VVNDVGFLTTKCDKRKKKDRFGPILDTPIASKVAARKVGAVSAVDFTAPEAAKEAFKATRQCNASVPLIPS